MVPYSNLYQKWSIKRIFFVIFSGHFFKYAFYGCTDNVNSGPICNLKRIKLAHKHLCQGNKGMLCLINGMLKGCAVMHKSV